MRTINGQATGPFHPIVGEVSTTGRPFYARSNVILATPHLDMGCLGYAGCITNGEKGTFLHPVTLWHADKVEQLTEGDIVCLNEDGTATVIWEKDSLQNALLLTEACNCNCLMCPQPPQKHEPMLLRQAEKVLDLLRGKSVSHICITGGEPTLLKENFIRLLRRCTQEHPDAVINILTNGKTFSDMSFATETARAASINTLFCVSLHSEIDHIHDEIVGKKGSFDETQLGIYNLAQCGARLEIRHVITKLNYKRLLHFAEHLYGYFPFCSHYALMGLELCGHAAANEERVAVFPHEYKEELAQAVLYMDRRGLPVSIYNIPLCLCDTRIRPFARQSISTWKNRYAPQCSGCYRQEDCAGFFSTSVSLPLDHIQPIKEEV